VLCFSVDILVTLILDSSFFLYSHDADSVLRSFPTRRSSDLSYAVKVSLVLGLLLCWGLLIAPVLVALLPWWGARPTLLLPPPRRSEEHTSELQSRFELVCRLLLEKKNKEVVTYK